MYFWLHITYSSEYMASAHLTIYSKYITACVQFQRKTCYRHSQSHSVKLLIKLVECIWNGFCLAFTILMRVHNLLTRKMHNENETNTNIKQRLNATYIKFVLHIFRKCLCICDLSLVCVSSIKKKLIRML